MANKSNTAMLLKLALVVFSVCLIITMVESRQLGSDSAAAPVCKLVIGAEAGDTCSGVASSFNLTPEEFGAINPNINCNKIFIGQWLCVDGSAK